MLILSYWRTCWSRKCEIRRVVQIDNHYRIQYVESEQYLPGTFIKQIFWTKAELEAYMKEKNYQPWHGLVKPLASDSFNIQNNQLCNNWRREMNAKDAYNLAKQRGDISVYLRQIESAAMDGQLELALDHKLNEFQSAALLKLGYMIDNNYDGYSAISSRTHATAHKISWRYATETPDPKMMALGAKLT